MSMLCFSALSLQGQTTEDAYRWSQTSFAGSARYVAMVAPLALLAEISPPLMPIQRALPYLLFQKLDLAWTIPLLKIQPSTIIIDRRTKKIYCISRKEESFWSWTTQPTEIGQKLPLV